METETAKKTTHFNFVKTSGQYLRWKQVEVRDGLVFMRLGMRTRKVVKSKQDTASAEGDC